MLKLASFQADATPPLGTPLCFGLCKNPARKIIAPLSAGGIVLTGAGAPLVICAVEWTAIGAWAYDFWRNALAGAARTSPERVVVHTTHPHDAPGQFFTGKDFKGMESIAPLVENTAFGDRAAARLAAALEKALKRAEPVTHYGLGQAKVERVASNRRIIGPDGRVAHTRFSACADKKIRALPEGLIDPRLKILSFWNGDKPLAALSFYATHPQSFYNLGGVNPDFVGLARSLREAALPETAHLHFDGCSGNVTAGKYNDRSPENRLVLALQIFRGMEAAWANTQKYPLKTAGLRWRTTGLSLPFNQYIAGKSEEDLLQKINDRQEQKGARIWAALGLAFKQRQKAGILTPVSCLAIGRLRALFLPGEMFIEYQLAAQKIARGKDVLVAGYGNYETGYVGTKAAYAQGGYETSAASQVGPGAEKIILKAMRAVLH